MPRLIDTSLDVLGQEPLAGAMPTAELLQLAEILDRAGFAYLEVSGGGVFDDAVRRAVESPWERIRAIKAHTKTPLALAIRGRFLVGARPVGGDLARRFVSCAADSGIDVFRLYDPLNDVDNLREAAGAIVVEGKELDVGLVYGSHRQDALTEAGKRVSELGATRILLLDPAGLLQPARAGELVTELRELSGLAVGLYSQGAGRNALSAAVEASRAGADLIASAVYPVALAVHRVSGEAAAQALEGLGLDTGIDLDVLWQAAELADEHIGDMPVAPLLPRISLRTARRKIPLGIVAAVDAQLRARSAGGRLDAVLDELERVRLEAGSPPLAPPIGQIIASQALVNVLGATRYDPVIDELRDLATGHFGQTPGPIDPALARAVELLGPASEPEADFDSVREEAKGLASSEEELLLLALFGDDAEALLHSIRDRSGGEDTLESRGVDKQRAERIRDVVKIVQESGIGEITVEEDGMRVRVRRSVAAQVVAAEPGAETAAPEVVGPATRSPGLVGIESPMVGTFYRSATPGDPAFVEEGDAVSPGQTLCILEAMKLMNEVKAEFEGVVRKIHVANGDPVEYGQLLLELEPVGSAPPTI